MSELESRPSSEQTQKPGSRHLRARLTVGIGQAVDWFVDRLDAALDPTSEARARLDNQALHQDIKRHLANQRSVDQQADFTHFRVVEIDGRREIGLRD